MLGKLAFAFHLRVILPAVANALVWTLLVSGDTGIVNAMLQTIPVLLLFFGAQRYFMQGLLLTGLSGR
jgi:ABC-type glycerol-3-phosphate transport system permease component